MSKPKVFIGSSVEGLEIAYAIHENLKFVAEVTVWDQGAFNLSETTLESLLSILESSDFGVFVFSPDDYIKIRGKNDLTVRDNVLFELGLFVGKLGRKRSFIVVPDNQEFHLPTDLIGMTPGKYEAERNDKNMQAGTGSASHKIREAIKKLGPLNTSNESPEIVSISKIEVTPKKEEWVDYLFQKKDYDKTIELLKKKIRYAKDQDEKIYFKGWICYCEFQKDSVKGTKEYEKLIAENSTKNTAYFPFINSLIWINNYKGALEVCETAISKCERKVHLTRLKAECLYALGKKDEANKLLENILKTNPEPETFLRLAQNFIESNDNKSALEVLHKAYFVFPNNEDLIYKFATTAYDVNQKEICVFIYRELLSINPENSTYWCLLGNAYLDLELENLALTSYEKARELSKSKEGWIFDNIGNLYKNKNLYDKAEENLKLALTLNDKSDYTHNRLSSIYASKQEQDKKLNEILAIAKTKINSDAIMP